jgi:dsRNA-specific ribonuclease
MIKKDQMSSYKNNGLRIGIRGDKFDRFITGLLTESISALDIDVLKTLTTLESMKEFSNAFTSKFIDWNNNYEIYEQLGDLSCNKFVVDFIYKKYPSLKTSSNIKISSRLKFLLVSKDTFSNIANELGFEPYISATNEQFATKRKDLLEDCFEAFIGCVESIVDSKYPIGYGYRIVYNILKPIFSKISIPHTYEGLVDSNTRYSELTMFIQKDYDIPNLFKMTSVLQGDINLSTITLSTQIFSKNPSLKNKIENILRLDTRYPIVIGKGFSSMKDESIRLASADAILTLGKLGFTKSVPTEYQEFERINSITPHEVKYDSVIDLNTYYTDEKYNINIDTLFRVKTDNIHTKQYRSTLLALHCINRSVDGVLNALKAGANVHVLDSNGSSVLDLLFIGKIDNNTVEKIFQLLLKARKDTLFTIQRTVYQTYYIYYIGKVFRQNLQFVEVIE